MNSAPKSPAKPEPASQPQKADNATAPAPKEIGGRRGPEPTRYGDWENGGKCVDF